MGCCQSRQPEGEGEEAQIFEQIGHEGLISSQSGEEGHEHGHATQRRPNSSRRTQSRGHSGRSQLAPEAHYNKPLKLKPWTSKRPWTTSQLAKERREFFETRVSGQAEIWATLSTVTELARSGDIATAQSILDAAAITLPTGNLKNGAYDDHGNFYSMPEHIISDPRNIVHDDNQTDIRDEKNVNGHEPISESEGDYHIEDKGKGVQPQLQEKEPIKVRARLSDRGGPDVIIDSDKSHTVAHVTALLRSDADIAASRKVRIAYLGKILLETRSLVDQGWTDGHVINALVFDEVQPP